MNNPSRISSSNHWFTATALLTGLLATTIHWHLWQAHLLLPSLLLWLTITLSHLWLLHRLNQTTHSPHHKAPPWTTLLLLPFLTRFTLLTAALILAKILKPHHPTTWLLLWGALPILAFFLSERKTSIYTTHSP